MGSVLNRTLSCQKKDGLLVIRIFPVNDRLEVAQLSNALVDLRTDALLDADIRVIVLTGAEDSSFMIEPIPFDPGSEDNAALVATSGSLAEPIAGLEAPVIAAIHGDAIGRGLELALACDMRIAAETSGFALTHVRTGIVPWDGGTQRLSRLVGRGKAMEMILTGQRIDAQEALRIGLVNRIVPRAEVTAAAMDMAGEMARKGPIALRYAKEAVFAGMDMTLEQGLRLEADLNFLLQTTLDRTEGIGAFFKKGGPHFEGN